MRKPMFVNLSHNRHSAPYARMVPLDQAFPDCEERSGIREELELAGYVECGGGAAPYVYVTVVKRRYWPRTNCN